MPSMPAMREDGEPSDFSRGKSANKIPQYRASSEGVCEQIHCEGLSAVSESHGECAVDACRRGKQVWPPILGVLQCGTCSFRVTGLKPLHCCSECARSNGESHSELCLQLPLQPTLLNHTSRSKGSSQRLAVSQNYGIESHFEHRLHRLLANGSVQLGCLPGAWDEFYGIGSWLSDRPVKQASKACGPPYAHGIEILDGWVHAVEYIEDSDPTLGNALERDVARFASLPLDAITCLRLEFVEIVRGKRISMKLALVQDVCRCQIHVKEKIENEDALLVDSDNVEVVGFGRTWENALVIARLAALDQLGHWSEPSEACFQNLLEVRSQLERLHDWMVDTAVALEIGELASAQFRDHCLNLVDGLCCLFVTPPRCEAACWDVLRRIWPHVVSLQETNELSRLISAIRHSGVKLPLKEWAYLGEIACWSLHFKALEPLRDLDVAEQWSSAAAVYIKYNLYSLFLEQRAQLQQELEKVASQPPATRLWVEMNWKIRSGCWHCSFRPELLGGSKGIMLLSVRGDIGNSVICNLVDEGQAVLRGSMGINSLLSNISTASTSVLFLAGYLIVHTRQREAVLNLMDNVSPSPFDSALSCLLLGSWERYATNEQDAQALHQARFLAAGPPGPFPSEEILDCLEIPSRGDSMISYSCYAPPNFSSAQTAALQNALSRRLSLIRGPPGTGKTHVAAGIVAAVLRSWAAGGEKTGYRRSRVLATTHSNVAAANLHRRLESFSVRAARIGTTLTPKEVLEQLLICELTSPQDLEELALLREAIQATKPLQGEDAHKLATAQFYILQRLAEKADAIVCTCASSGHRGLLSKGMGDFPILVIDEAAQFVEPGPWVPLGLGSAAFVAVGDERQLPATILDDKASERRLGVSMFERCVRDGIVALEDGFVQLDVQHRMHPSIAEFPAKTFYEDGGGLQNAPEVDLTKPILGFPWPSSSSRVCFVDCGRRGDGEDGSRSRANRREAELLVSTLKRLLQYGMDPSDIAVITGYSAQQALLKQLVAHENFLAEGLKIDTIDGFQGAEREIVLASTVRSNCSGEVGFMRDRRRVNVLLTRARRGLVVFGDMTTLAGESVTWQPWLEWAESRSIVMGVDDLVRHFREDDGPTSRELSTDVMEDDGWIIYTDPGSCKRWRWHEAKDICEWIDLSS